MGELPVWVAAAIVGYLVGSVSSARLLARRLVPGRDLSTTEWPIDEDGVLVSRRQARAGRRFPT